MNVVGRFGFMFLWFVFAIACNQKAVVINSSHPENAAGQETTETIGTTSSVPAELIQQYILAMVDTSRSESYRQDLYYNKEIFKELKSFYRYNHDRLAWSTLQAPNSDAKELLNALSQAHEHGLDPEAYGVSQIVTQIEDVYQYKGEIDLKKVIQLDFLITHAYMTYAYHLYHGQLPPHALGEDWHIPKKRAELAPYLAGKSFRDGVKMIIPQSKAYTSLQKKLITYQAIAAEGGWNTIPDSMWLRPGGIDDAVYLLSERLFYSNDYKKGPSATSTSTYDEDLEKSLSYFQQRHGLTPDGKLNESTIKALNVPVEKRIDQIRMNLERLRWLPEMPNGKSVVINLPEYRLHIYKKEKELENMKVIIGKNTSKTPIMLDQIEYITFRPSWFVPTSRFNRTVLPKVKKDPDYLDRYGYRLYARKDIKRERPIDSKTIKWQSIDHINDEFRAVHLPGPNGDMKGQIMFAMPNSEGLFICDASNTALFEFSLRPFNYSTISVEKPELLAKVLLNNRKWDIREIKHSMAGEKPESVTLEEKVPVQTIYLTAWVNEEGILQFREDIYGYDALQYDLMQLEDQYWRQD